MNANQVVIGGVIDAVEPLRYSPGGIPLIGFVLRHESTQSEAGNPVQVWLEMSSQAAGKMAQVVAGLSPGTRVVVKGFLARRTQRDARPVLHVNKLKLQGDDDASSDEEGSKERR